MPEPIRLSERQEEVLRAAADGPFTTYRTQEFRAGRTLVFAGLLSEHSGRTFRITAAGRRWLEERKH